MLIPQRPRRNRRTEAARNLISETHLTVDSLVWPLFVTEGRDVKVGIKTLPGCHRMSPDQVLKEIAVGWDLGLRSFAFFPSINNSKKTSGAEESYNPNGLIPEVLKKIKDRFPDSILITDVALDPYSSDGHDGLVKNGKVLNDETVEVLIQQALMQARAGADYVAPSDMMDGRVGAIRGSLEREGFSDTGIIAYTAKYASAFYGPFREALDSAPKFGDKKTYQMDYRNRTEALRELRLDEIEGADMVMVKPALCYLDIIAEFSRKSRLPVAAYNVSGEYAMIKAAAQLGMLDETKAMVEMLTSIRRAGASVIFTYFAAEMARYLQKA